MASVPSSTALAASLTSARVGRARASDHMLLHTRDLLQRHLETQIAPRDHQAIGNLQNVIQVVDRRRALDLGDDRGHTPGPAHHGLPAPHVVGVLYEAECDQIDTQFEPEAQIVFILFGDRRRRERNARRIDAFALPQRATVHDQSHELVHSVLDHAQLDPAIIEQKTIANLRGSNQGAVGRVHAARTTRLIARGDSQRISCFQNQSLAPFERPGSDLRPAEILHDRHVAPQISGSIANRRVGGSVGLVGAVGKVEPEHVRAGRQQLAQHGGRTTCRSDGCDDLCTSHSFGASVFKAGQEEGCTLHAGTLTCRVASRICFLGLLLISLASTASAQGYVADKPRRHFVTISYDSLYTHPLHFADHPLSDLVGGDVAAAQFETYDYRTRDGATLIDVVEFGRRQRGAGVTLYPFGMNTGPALMLRGSYEYLPRILIAFDGPSRVGEYALTDGRAFDVAAGLTLADRSPGWGLGSHAFVAGGIGRITSGLGDGRRLFAEAGGGLSVGPFGVELSMKFARNRLSEPVHHSFLTVPVTLRGTLTF